MENDAPNQHPDFVGWSEEMETGSDMPCGPDEIQLKIIAKEDGIQVVAVGEDMQKVRRILLAVGFEESQIKKLICG
ncbi:MAG: hypothetical protein H6557_01650 [Lewinellaceae bacterium]|nr:hypothetical protein [Phaeodactylibacter sp.]MCB9035302.1 hypothetical protein [Lewinellaceae bacterium]